MLPGPCPDNAIPPGHPLLLVKNWDLAEPKRDFHLGLFEKFETMASDRACLTTLDGWLVQLGQPHPEELDRSGPDRAESTQPLTKLLDNISRALLPFMPPNIQDIRLVPASRERKI